MLGSNAFARLRFGMGNDFPRGMQIDYVLGHPSDEELAILPQRIDVAIEAIKAFCLSGLNFAMTNFNNK
jgi:PTH1 family peptidyl-tRNA hydrolase